MNTIKSMLMLLDWANCPENARVPKKKVLWLILMVFSVPLLRGQEGLLQSRFDAIAKSTSGELGISALHLETGESISYQGKGRFPMQSVYKVPIAMAMLRQIDVGNYALSDTIQIEEKEYIPKLGHSPIRDAYPGGVKLTIEELLRYNVSQSDGTACDVLLRLLGGTGNVQQSVRNMGVGDMAIATTEMVQVSNDTIQYQNWSTPEGMTQLLQILFKGNYLTEKSRDFLLELMSFSNPYFDRRIKGLLPVGTPVVHKTGAARTFDGLTRATNDAGIVTLPDGTHMIISVFVKDSHASSDTRALTIAKVARQAFDYWSTDPKGFQKLGRRYLDAHQAYDKARCPIPRNGMKHFVYFARDRRSLVDHPFLSLGAFEGAQIMYPWSVLEVEEGKYDFSIIEEDLRYLGQHGKTLFIQLQDATFDPNFNAVPSYMRNGEYQGGAMVQFNEAGKPDGWIAKRWNPKVRERFASLLKALGDAFDGRIEGINLQETAINWLGDSVSGFTPWDYEKGVKANMLALRRAFPHTTTMVYANFMPGEWLPIDDMGYLKRIYQYGESIGVGLGCPDLLMERKGQLNHALAQMHEGTFTVPLGVAVQDGNYIGETGAIKGHGGDGIGDDMIENRVPKLYAFALDFLKVDYMFWVNQEPYFESQVLPCFD